MKAGTGEVKTVDPMMEPRPTLSLADRFAAVQGWWREAGVDLAFTDATEVWLGQAEDAEAPLAGQPQAAPAAAPAKKARPRIGGAPESWPQDLGSFAPWWLAEPSLAPGGGAARVAPAGPHEAELMILVPQPEAEDRESLLSGPLGRLLRSFLSAAGMAPESIYLASALPRHAPHVDWAGLTADGLDAVTLHHISLAAPRRLLVFGQDILPLIGHDPAQNPAFLRKINHQDGSIPVLGERSLEFLLARPAARSGFWRRWLDWTGH